MAFTNFAINFYKKKGIFILWRIFPVPSGYRYINIAERKKRGFVREYC
jgi:hypothetical protein